MCARFIKVFPTTTSHKYFQYFEGPRYYNMLFDAWEYAHHADRSKGKQTLAKYILALVLWVNNEINMGKKSRETDHTGEEKETKLRWRTKVEKHLREKV
jgi:hypothetical protein